MHRYTKGMLKKSLSLDHNLCHANVFREAALGGSTQGASNAVLIVVAILSEALSLNTCPLCRVHWRIPSLALHRPFPHGLGGGGWVSLAKPFHIKPSRPLLVEQVLICGVSKMLQLQCVLVHLTHMHKHVPEDLRQCFVAVYLLSALTSLIDHFISHTVSMECWASFIVFYRVCFCLVLSQWAFFQRSKGIQQKSPLVELIKYKTSLAFQEFLIL